MSDFRKQVRDHYDKQSLPAEKLEAILARGREAAAGGEKTVAFPGRKRWVRFIGAVAAAVALAMTGGWWATRDVGAVSYAALPPRVIEFFKEKSELLPPLQDKSELRTWLVSQGAPADMEIPAKLQSLESAACQVVDVKGRNAYLSCYWRVSKADRGPGDLVHLLVARTEDFRDQPGSAQAVVRELDGWSFASWTKGETIYTLATANPMEQLTPFLSARDRVDDGSRDTASVGFTRVMMAAIVEARASH
ncbi:hypothetical protein OKA05_18300 [Luteolibacter arcticus]|uniref:Anti-sigma factor n=1 Tax=Luteolibacter arcticus TaxID=1581411 RepID=A0ABT3GLZ1_9BACT|nr:hypothetical protein [Luteolibacter arcticus]MCW1924523.1 hypothetical protein [Luteolibacter arcticus]